jgi:hypothetical protein
LLQPSIDELLQSLIRGRIFSSDHSAIPSKEESGAAQNAWRPEGESTIEAAIGQ